MYRAYISSLRNAIFNVYAKIKSRTKRSFILFLEFAFRFDFSVEFGWIHSLSCLMWSDLNCKLEEIVEIGVSLLSSLQQKDD